MNTIIDPRSALRHYFGYDDFREGQREVIDNTLKERDGFVAMRTGGGKSLCYQIPAVCLPGTALVVSPLIALMKDQVDALTERGIAAAALNSNMTPDEVSQTLHQAQSGKLKLLYISPERFDSGRFQRALESIPVSFVAIDEAHCISVWGPDFRLAYRRLPDSLDMIDRFAGRRLPRIALTATATPAVRDDVSEQLRLSNPTQFMLGYNRDNLTLLVDQLGPSDDKDEALKSYLASRPKGEATIIYSATIKAMPSIAAAAAAAGRRVTLYHGRLSPSDRRKNQDQFLRGEIDTIVATNAFGMGIDKSDIREVIHYHLPASLENYYQEVGRGGRDGKPARGMLLYQKGQDERLQQFFIDGNHPHPNAVRALFRRLSQRSAGRKDALEINKKQLTSGIESVTPFQGEALLRRLKHAGVIDYQEGNDYDSWSIEVKPSSGPLNLGDLPAQRRTAEKSLESMVRFASTRECRRKVLLEHFGEKDTPDQCGQCDQCLSMTQRRTPSAPSSGVSPAAVSVLLSLIDSAPRPLSVDETGHVLLGVRDERLVREGLSGLELFGRLKHYNQSKLWGLFAHVSSEGWVRMDGTALRLTSAGQSALERAQNSGSFPGSRQLASRRPPASPVDQQLNKALLLERHRLARRAGVHPMMIASEAAITAMAKSRPSSVEALEGLGILNPAQQRRFGAQLLRSLRDHVTPSEQRQP